MGDAPSLLSLSEQLLEQAEKLRPLPDLLRTSEGGDLRDTLLLYLQTKVLPELRDADNLPIFVGVQGGANVGKSTVFNALAGKILSPSIVQASATKHPLVFVHSRWRDRFFPRSPIGDVTCEELEDPKDLTIRPERTDLLYFRFHEDDSLGDLALIDSPDFDSALVTNLQVARRITALADVTLFVTTAQKYRDRELVERLRALKELKASVLLVFNMVDQEIVFRTLVDDLEDVLPLERDGVRAVRLPASRGPHPEEDVREALRQQVLEELESFEPAQVKPGIVRRTVRRIVERVEELLARYGPELDFKEKLLTTASREVDAQVRDYATRFDLGFPEETLAIRRLIQMTELAPRLRLPRDVESGSNVFKLLGVGLRRANEAIRDWLVRFSRSAEGTIEEGPEALALYARSRNEVDVDSVLRGAERLRVAVETLCRSNQPNSALARELLVEFFTPGRLEGFADAVRGAHGQALDGLPQRDEEILERLDNWKRRHPIITNALFGCAMLFKVSAGALLAYVLPPDGLLSVLNWLYFALGYFVAAYLVALGCTLGVRRRLAFKKTRVGLARSALEAAFLEPLRETLDSLLSRQELEALGETSRKLGESACGEAAESASQPAS